MPSAVTPVAICAAVQFIVAPPAQEYVVITPAVEDVTFFGAEEGIRARAADLQPTIALCAQLVSTAAPEERVGVRSAPENIGAGTTERPVSALMGEYLVAHAPTAYAVVAEVTPQEIPAPAPLQHVSADPATNDIHPPTADDPVPASASRHRVGTRSAPQNVVTTGADDRRGWQVETCGCVASTRRLAGGQRRHCSRQRSRHNRSRYYPALPQATAPDSVH